MWGSSFSDLAKKMEEQASSAFSTSSMFNLDAMQQGQESKIESVVSKPKTKPVGSSGSSTHQSQSHPSTFARQPLDSHAQKNAMGLSMKPPQQPLPSKQSKPKPKPTDFFANHDWSSSPATTSPAAKSATAETKSNPSTPKKKMATTKPLWSDPIKSPKKKEKRLQTTTSSFKTKTEKAKPTQAVVVDTVDTTTTKQVTEEKEASKLNAMVKSSVVVSDKNSTAPMKTTTTTAKAREKASKLKSPAAIANDDKDPSTTTPALQLLQQVQEEMSPSNVVKQTATSPQTTLESKPSQETCLLSPEIKNKLQEINQTSVELDSVLKQHESGRLRQIVSSPGDGSDYGSIDVEWNNLEQSEKELTRELQVAEQENDSQAKEEQTTTPSPSQDAVQATMESAGDDSNVPTMSSAEEMGQVENVPVVMSAEETDAPTGQVDPNAALPTRTREVVQNVVEEPDTCKATVKATRMDRDVVEEVVPNDGKSPPPLVKEEMQSNVATVKGTNEANKDHVQLEPVSKETTQMDEKNSMPTNEKVSAELKKEEPSDEALVEHDGANDMSNETPAVAPKATDNEILAESKRDQVSEVAKQEKVDNTKKSVDTTVPATGETIAGESETKKSTEAVAEQQQETMDTQPSENGSKETPVTDKQGMQQQQDAPAAESLSDNVMGMFSNQLVMLSTFGTTGGDGSPAAGDKIRNQQQGTKPPATQMNAATKQKDSVSPKESSITPNVLDHFTGQLQRLEQHHADEIKELEERHGRQLAKASKKDEWFKKMRQLEKDYERKLKESTEEIATVLQKNEGMALKMEVLQRELDGTRAILDKKENDLGLVNESHSRDVHKVEQRLKDAQDKASASAAEVERLKDALKESKAELEASHDSFNKLKARTKVVATELKERRVECRGLHANVSELNSKNESLEKQIEEFQSRVSRQDRSRAESEQAIERLRTQVSDLENELAASEKKLKERDAFGEKALAAYKKKAQASLAVANARAACANNAREESEVEASSLKSSAEQALESARAAEAKAKQMMIHAKDLTKTLEQENERLLREASESNDTLERTREDLGMVRSELQDAALDNKALVDKVDKISGILEEERNKAVELTRSLNETNVECDALRSEVDTLREELRRMSVSFVRKESDVEYDGGGTADSELNTKGNANGGKLMGDVSESEATILMLQQELDDANEAIKELQEALKGSLSQGRDVSPYREGVSSPKSRSPYSQPTYQQEPGENGAATPLFYALEKQAELNTARDEITRLANLLGDAESAKMEAYDAMDEMRRKMEEAEARLRRQEKLGPAAPTRAVPQNRPSVNGSTAVATGPASLPLVQEQNGDTSPTKTSDASNSAIVSLEYLKNVMLSYLNAKTQAERKALLPVLSAVLELTPDEQAQASQTVEESGELLHGVGNAFLESLGSKVNQLM